MARAVGGGFGAGLLAGTQAASKWIDVYNQSKQQQEVDAAIQPQGGQMQEIGTDYLKNSFGLDDNAAATLLDQLRADPTKARDLLNATNALTGGAADSGAQPKGVDALGRPVEAARTSAIDMRGPQGAALPDAVANPDQISRRYPDAVAGRPSPQQSFATSRAAQLAALSKELGVSPALLGGQFGLETGWGKSILPGSENLGNIKAGAGYTGRTVRAQDKAEGSNDAYRAYDNPEAFSKDFATLIKTRYPGAVGAGDDAEKYFNALKAGGYATDPDYVKKGVSAVEAYRKAAPGGNLAAAPEAVQAQAIQTPGGAQAMADDIGQMEKIADKIRIPKNAQFSVGADGKITMNTPNSPADQYLRVAQVYLKNGRTAEAKQAMDMHFQTKASEAADYVKDIMSDDSLSTDQKIGALARGTGIRIYKDKDGGYVSPDLAGGPGEGGKHKRLSMADIAQYANLMTTPEGMKYLYGHQLEQQKANNASRTVALQERQEGTATTPGSMARLREAQANYYDQRPDIAAMQAAARAAGAGAKEKGDVTTVQPDQTYAVKVPSGPNGASETRQMQLFSPPAGVQGGTGMMDSSQVAKLPDILKQISKSPYGDPEGSGVRVGVQANPVQFDPGEKTVTSHAGMLSGQYSFPVTMTNPATGQREAVAFINGKPVWASEGKGVPNYRTVEQAEKAAQQLQEYFIKQKQPEVNAERAAAKEALDNASAVRVPPHGIRPRKTKKEE